MEKLEISINFPSKSNIQTWTGFIFRNALNQVQSWLDGEKSLLAYNHINTGIQDVIIFGRELGPKSVVSVKEVRK